ncbi:glucosylglycerol phosphatase [Stanieria cyanosphaera PCC 7437]|uniref:Glucosylglycerol phosphatase n=1 Tax=Stanieria cyanosphaera (strain ATCC 29371 / PCC 7437) TaxID=111780 RepID=K9XT58_STAC7|nr:glucosylglycerol 3-phosphatase [Stanieria cyanosphaera]AFZ35790.1 glucosylglycerol phosphatase [Stanieria cyanosphaera PCC 7437]
MSAISNKHLKPQRCPLHQRSFSLDHQTLTQLLTERENILIIQDLDGVCMGLVKDPLARVIDKKYLEATQAFAGHFFVLTNGEHIGKRGVNLIVEKAFGNPDLIKEKGLYLPGLAGGGVQWQDCYGNVSHPGVSSAELAFLAEVPQQIEAYLQQILPDEPYNLAASQIDKLIQATVLDNPVSPTVNLNIFYEVLRKETESYRQLQQEIQRLLEKLLQKAQQKALENSFFVHYAPNLGRDAQGQERIELAQGQNSGTTDFQFMLRGAIKEVGVLVILNHYYYGQTGSYPLGKDFNARQAPRSQQALLDLIKDNFDPEIMPTIVGVGDTVTSKAEENNGQLEFCRGGSDRGFLELIQAIGREFQTENVTVYVDSSHGEVKNRKPLKLESWTNHDSGAPQTEWRIIEGPGDHRDTEDPLRLNVVFPGGYQQYLNFFQTAASQRVS